MHEGTQVVVVVTSSVSGGRARAVARWVRALLPAAALVVSAPGLSRGPPVECARALVVDADALPSGPLSLADALARAAGAA